MAWNGNLRPPFASQPDNSLSFFHNYIYESDPVLEMKQSIQTPLAVHPMTDKNNYGSQEKKKRLTNDQLESLESSFQEEIKLDPDRKMKLAKELGLQPRQIAVWFQNRRARWKAKQLERLYDALKEEFDVVSREKQKLQEEVTALRSILKERAPAKPVSAGYTEISHEETAESTSMPSFSNKSRGPNNQQQMAECSNIFNADDYSNLAVMAPYWTGLPTYP